LIVLFIDRFSSFCFALRIIYCTLQSARKAYYNKSSPVIVVSVIASAFAL